MTGPRRWTVGFLLIAGIVAVVFFRAPRMILAPPLLFDDGAKVFAHFYMNRGVGEILRFKSGYLPLVGNVIGYLAVRLPTRIIPYGFVGAAVAITAGTYALLFAEPFRRRLPSDGLRALICLLFALAPLSGCIQITSSDYSIWNLLAVLILLTTIPPAGSPPWNCLQMILCGVLVWAHPLSIIILPVVFWFIWKGQSPRLFYRLLFFDLVLHQIFGVAGIISTQGLWKGGTQAFSSAEIFDKSRAALSWTWQLIPDTAFRAAFGSQIFEQVLSQMPALIVIWFAILLGLSSGVIFLRPRLRSIVAYLFYLIASLTFLSCFLRYENVHADPVSFVTYAPRYIYLQSLSYIALFVILIAGLVEIAADRINREGALLDKYQHWIWPPLLLLVAHYFYLNTQFGYYTSGHPPPAGPYYDSNPANGVIVRDFFYKLALEEKKRGSREGIYLVAEKRNDWPIIIDTRHPRRAEHFYVTHRARVILVLLGFFILGYCSRRLWLKRLRSPPDFA